MSLLPNRSSATLPLEQQPLGTDAMSFDNLMQSFANGQNLGKLEKQNNHFYLTIDTQMEITCFQANSKFYAYGVIAMLPSEDQKREQFLQEILQKNLALLMSERVALCVEPDADVLAIYLTRPLQGLTEEKIESAIATLANNYELFLKLASQEQLAPPPSAPMMLMP